MTEAFSGETVQNHEQMNDVLKDIIVQIPEPQPVIDRYQRQYSRFHPVESAHTVTYSLDGKIGFSKDYEVRRREIEEFELIYVLHRDGHTGGAFYIHTFAPEGGLLSRTKFEHVGTSHIVKRYSTPPWSPISGGPSYHDDVYPSDFDDLFEAMRHPATNIDWIRAATTPTAYEQQQLDARAQEHRERAERWRQEDERLRPGFIPTHDLDDDIIIG
jgi:hypothetical protein